MKNEIEYGMVVITKYLGPTNTLGSRIRARDSHGWAGVTVEWRNDWSPVQNHVYAANRLVDKYLSGYFDGDAVRTPRRWVGESSKTGYVLVCCPAGRQNLEDVEGFGDLVARGGTLTPPNAPKGGTS